MRPWNNGHNRVLCWAKSAGRISQIQHRILWFCGFGDVVDSVESQSGFFYLILHRIEPLTHDSEEGYAGNSRLMGGIRPERPSRRKFGDMRDEAR